LKKARKAGFQQEGVSASDFKREGNNAHYTEWAIASRKRLRTNKSIVRWLQKYWDTFASDGETIGRDAVIAVQTKFCKALFDPEDWSLPEATQAAETEWAREMGATAQTMSRDMFFDSLFEIVDVWTLEIDSNEYVQAHLPQSMRRACATCLTSSATSLHYLPSIFHMAVCFRQRYKLFLAALFEGVSEDKSGRSASGGRKTKGAPSLRQWRPNKRIRSLQLQGSAPPADDSASDEDRDDDDENRAWHAVHQSPTDGREGERGGVAAGGGSLGAAALAPSVTSPSSVVRPHGDGHDAASTAAPGETTSASAGSANDAGGTAASADVGGDLGGSTGSAGGGLGKSPGSLKSGLKKLRRASNGLIAVARFQATVTDLHRQRAEQARNKAGAGWLALRTKMTASCTIIGSEDACHSSGKRGADPDFDESDVEVRVGLYV
jgi:hypothetical protein